MDSKAVENIYKVLNIDPIRRNDWIKDWLDYFNITNMYKQHHKQSKRSHLILAKYISNISLSICLFFPVYVYFRYIFKMGKD